MKNTIIFTLTMLTAPYAKFNPPVEPCFAETTQVFSMCTTSCNPNQPIVIKSGQMNKITDADNWCKPFILNIV